MKDLFGIEIDDRTGHRRKRGSRRDHAHAALPGTGPAGETCTTCAHRRRVHGGVKVYQKCWLIRQNWTSGPGTDIRCKDPACRFWQPPAPAEPTRENPCAPA